MTKVITALDHSINILICIRNNNLEWTKEFSAAKVEILDKLLETYLNCSWLIGSINFRNVVLN